MKPRARFHREGGAWRLTAPGGYRFADGVHEFVLPERGFRRPEALAEFMARERGEPLELCLDPACEWCHPDCRCGAPLEFAEDQRTGTCERCRQGPEGRRI